MNSTIIVIALSGIIAVAIFYFSVRALTDNETVRRWVLRTLVGGTLLFVLLAGGIWVHLGGIAGTSAARIQALQAQGLPTNGAELNEYYCLPAGARDDTKAWEAALGPLMDVKLTPDQMEAVPVVGLKTLEQLQRGKDWTQQAEVEILLDQQKEHLEQLRVVARRGGYTRFRVDFSPRPLQAKLDYLPQLRNAARWLSLSAINEAWQQEAASLGDDLTALLNLSKANRNDPVLISSLVNGAVFGMWFDSLRRAARLCALREEDCVRMQRLLLEFDFEQQMLRALRGERAMGLVELDVINSPLTVESRRAYLDYLEYHERLLQNPEDPKLEKLQDALLLGQNRILGKQRFFAVHLLAPALQHSIEAMRELEARRRIGVLALAAIRYQRYHGQLPNRIEQLQDFVPEADDRLWTDPCQQTAFVFVHTEDCVVIYSPGRDRVDDGGQIERTLSGDDAEPAKDAGIRLPARLP